MTTTERYFLPQKHLYKFVKLSFYFLRSTAVHSQWINSLFWNAGGNKLQTTMKMDESRAEAKAEASKPAAPSSGTQDPKTEVSDSLSTSALAALQSDVQPVGHDYVEEVSFDRPAHRLQPTYTSWAEIHFNIDYNMWNCFLGPKRWRQSHPLPLQAVWM